MNNIRPLLAAVLCFVFAAQLNAQNCHIDGRVAVSALQDKSIMVMNLNSGETLAKTIIKNNQFTFDIEVAEPFVGMLVTDPQTPRQRDYYYLRFVGEPGNIYCDLVSDSLSGTPMNNLLYRYTKKRNYEISAINAKYSKLKEAVSIPKEEQERIEMDVEKLYAEVVGLSKETFVQNKTNPVGAFAMEDYMELGEASYEEVQKMLLGSAPVVLNYQQLQKKLAAMEKLSHTAAGKHYIDLELTDYKSGKPVKLSKVIDGKVALIDFWASWCRPCRAEIPNLAKIHEKYGKNKEFVVVSLNVWDKPDAQAKAIKDLGMSWTQLTDATRNATETYAVDGIPQILLIGKDGVIIARDLRGEDIEPAVRKALEK